MKFEDSEHLIQARLVCALDLCKLTWHSIVAGARGEASKFANYSIKPVKFAPCNFCADFNGSLIGTF